jgi:hypothetical protein
MQKSIIFQFNIATTFIASVIAPKIQELIPLVFPLKIKGEKSWLLKIEYLAFSCVIFILYASRVVNLHV